MTDPMELVGRLEKLREEPSRFVFEVNAILTEAAACIREMVEQKEKLARRAERYREQVEVERKAYRNLLADHEGRTLPPAPGAEA